MKTLELNRIALWRAKLCDELTVRESGAGRPYAENHIIKRTTAKTFRYAKNYEKSGTKFCLFVVTYIWDEKMVEKYLDKVAKKIDVKTAKEVAENSDNSSFEYTNYYLEQK